MAATKFVCPVCGKQSSSSVAAGRCTYCRLQLGLNLAEPPQAIAPANPSAGSGDAATTDRMVDLCVLSEFGDYELLAEIARGGMGVVYLARQKGLKRLVAVKLVLAGQLATQESLQRFRLEAEAAARLHHSGIVQIYEIGEYETQHFFSMELIDGVSLAECLHEYVIQKTAQPTARREQELTIARLMVRVSLALDYAHQHGVLHRDLKPSNILIDQDGLPRLTDFGLAKLTGRETSGLTLSQAVLGTPGFLAPEQAAGNNDITTAADIYGLGATLYQLLTGKPPFVGANAVDTIMMTMQQDPLPPRQVHPTLHRDLETIALRCLEKQPAQRYHSAGAVADELDRFIRGEAILARPVSAAEMFWRWSQRNPMIASLLACLMVAISVGFAGVVWQWRRAERNNAQLTATIDRTRWDEIVEMTNRDENSEALAHLAGRLRRNPNDWRAAMLASSTLDHRRFSRPRCGAISHGTRAEIQDATFNPSGSQLATASIDGTARIWDADTGEELHLLRHADTVHHVSFCGDGKWVLTASSDKTAVLWNTSDGSPISTLRHPAAVRDAVFLTDRTLVATASSDGDVRVWKAAIEDENGGVTPFAEFNMNAGASTLAASPAGDRLAAGDSDGNVVVFSINEASELIRENSFSIPGAVDHVAFSHDGRFVMANAGKVRCWDAHTEELVFEGPAGALFTPSLSPRANYIHTNVGDRQTQVIDLNTGKPIADSMETKFRFFASSFSPDGQLLATGGWDYAAGIWSLVKNEPAVSPIHTDGVIRRLQFAADSKALLIVEGDAQYVTDQPPEKAAVTLWDIGLPFSDKRFVPKKGRPLWVAVHPRGDSFALSLPQTNTVVLLDRNLKQLGDFELPDAGGLKGIAFTPDGGRLVIGMGSGAMCCFDTATSKLLWGPLMSGSKGLCYRLSHDGRTFAYGPIDGNIRLVDVEAGVFVDSVLQHQGGDINDVCFSPDDRLLSSASDDHTANLWDIQSGQILHQFKHEFQVQACKFSPDGKLIVTSSNDFSARIWNVETGEPIGEPMRHQGEVGNASFSPDGKMILTSSRDGTARIWDASTGQPLVPFMIHASALREANFSPDGRLVVTVDHDALQVWDAATGQPVGVRIREASGIGVGHDTCGGRVPFFPDGSGVVWGHTTPVTQLIDTTIPPTPAPDWFPQMLEIIGGQRLDSTNSPVAIPLEARLAKRRHWQARPPTGVEFYRGRLTRWLSDSSVMPNLDQ